MNEFVKKIMILGCELEKAETDIEVNMIINDAEILYRKEIEALNLPVVSNWVTVESNIPPEVCTDVMVKYKDGRKEVAYFDGDNRFYIEKDDRDVSETIVSWHKLP